MGFFVELLSCQPEFTCPFTKYKGEFEICDPHLIRLKGDNEYKEFSAFAGTQYQYMIASMYSYYSWIWLIL